MKYHTTEVMSPRPPIQYYFLFFLVAFKKNHFCRWCSALPITTLKLGVVGGRQDLCSFLWMVGFLKNPVRFFPRSLCGVRIFDFVSRPSSRPPPPPILILPSSRNLLTHNLVTHNLVTHNLLTHNLLIHNLLIHNLLTHNLLTHNLLTHNLLTHNLLTHNLLIHNLLTHNLLTHNLLTHNFLTHNLLIHNLLTHTVADMALAWQAWHLETCSCTCVADMALGLETCSCTLRGRHGTLRHPPSFHVAGVTRMALDWLWRRVRFSAVAVIAAAFCVADVALGDI